MSDRNKKLRRARRRGWLPIIGSVGSAWMRRTKMPHMRVGDEVYVPPWVLELYCHLLPDDPPATKVHLAPMFALGRALASGVLTEAAVESAHCLGGPKAVVGLTAGLP